MKRKIETIYIFLLFAINFFSCTSEKIENTIPLNSTQTVSDTNYFSRIGFYHNIIVDSLNYFFETLPFNKIDSLIKDNYWVYSNVFVKAENFLKKFPEFQNIEFDTLRYYSFFISLRDIILDTNGFFDENLLEFLNNIYPNDTLVIFVNQILQCLTQPNRIELIDSLVDVVNCGNYSEMLKNAIIVGCNIGICSFNFWNGIIHSEMHFRKLNINEDKVLVAPTTVAIVGSDIIGGIASALTSSASGWEYARDIAVGAGAASAITWLGFGAGKVARLIDKIINKLKYWNW
ncbi:MAG: hypothetical protein QXY47_06155 [Thermoplasmata archaeon]